MENLRLTFLIFGIVAIVAILVHGLWTIRKNAKSNEKKKLESRNWQNKSEPLLDDDEQFDTNDVGSVRVVSSNKSVTNRADEEGTDYRKVDDTEHDDGRLTPSYDGSSASQQTEYQDGPEQSDVDSQPSIESASTMASEGPADIDKQATTDRTEVRSHNDLELDDDLTLERSEMDFAKLAEEHEQVAPKLYGSVVTQPKPGFQRSAKAAENSNRQAQSQDNTFIPEPPPILVEVGCCGS